MPEQNDQGLPQPGCDSTPAGRHTFFSHVDCEYFPCHKTDRPEDFNCLFCFCPLYCFGDRCGGNPRYTAGGTKDCSACLLPHGRDSHPIILERLKVLTDGCF
ncbi:MAG: hypothetical protein GXX99_02880 [Clostridiales bacterium]|nr:hypothetical protein [Clostridiales bacterium]